MSHLISYYSLSKTLPRSYYSETLLGLQWINYLKPCNEMLQPILVVEDVVIVYFTPFQDIASLASVKIYHDVYFKWTQLAKSGSVYPITCRASQLLKVSITSLVCWRCLITFLTVFRCSIPRLAWNLQSIPTAEAIFVWCKYICTLLPTTDAYEIFSLILFQFNLFDFET